MLAKWRWRPLIRRLSVHLAHIQEVVGTLQPRRCPQGTYSGRAAIRLQVLMFKLCIFVYCSDGLLLQMEVQAISSLLMLLCVLGLRYFAHKLVTLYLIVEALVLESCLQFAFDEAGGAFR